MDNLIKIPKITVLMPVYNCELYIKEAIESILNQTFLDFEFIIIDDSSTDKTVSIIKTFTDNRIQLIEKPVNTGLTNSLNYGLSIAKGEYIARMDGDDISLPERFAKQIDFLDKNPDVIVCGSFFKIIGIDKIITVPEKHEDNKLAMLTNCSIGHPTVMLRKKTLEQHSLIYDINKEPAEDYDLWTRLLSFGKLYNLQEVLLHYRIHNLQVSQKKKAQQIKIATEIKVNLLNYLNFEKNTKNQNLLNKMVRREQLLFEEIEQFFDFKSKLLLANDNSFFEKKGFEEYLLKIQNNFFKDYFMKRGNYSPKIYIQYCNIQKKWKYKLILKHEIKLFIKSIIFYKK